MRTPYALLMAASLTLAACGGKIETADPNPTPHDMKKGPGLFSGKSGNLLEAFNRDKAAVAAVGMTINPFLWRSSLEAVSFLPLAEVDSTGGVITTDWGKNPENEAERVKINILVLGRALQPQSLKVNLFKQEKQGSTWVDKPASEATVKQLENAILTEARRLRVKEKASY